MKRSLTLFLIFLAGFSNAQAQRVEFAYLSMDEALQAARDQEKVVVVYYYDESAGGYDAFAHLWDDPMVGQFVGDLAVAVAIDAASEEGDAFRNHYERRRKGDITAPGIYFFSDTGRSVGALHGDLEGERGVGRMMMMLGATTYVQKQKGGRRPSRRR